VEKSDNYVSLREHLERMVEFRFQASHEALGHARAELERRLEVLNHAHEQQIRDRGEFVKQKEYDIKTAYYDDWCRGVDRKLTAIETRAVTWTAAIALFFIIVEVALHFWGIGK
jgi:hypothetical protein